VLADGAREAVCATCGGVTEGVVERAARRQAMVQALLGRGQVARTLTAHGHGPNGTAYIPQHIGII
jgi:hypothetical protein